MLDRNFFNRDTLRVAKELLGKIIVINKNDITYRAMITETEAYLGINDRAAHTFAGRKTERNKIMYEYAGTIYVYQTYGIHYMLNFVTLDQNQPEAVLIRSVDPIDGINQMSINRFEKTYEDLNNYQKKNLTNGPGKLTKALDIDKSFNGKNLFTKDFYITEGKNNFQIETDVRIGIDYAMEAIDYPYRFYIKDNPHVSKIKRWDYLISSFVFSLKPWLISVSNILPLFLITDPCFLGICVLNESDLRFESLKS